MVIFVHLDSVSVKLSTTYKRRTFYCSIDLSIGQEQISEVHNILLFLDVRFIVTHRHFYDIDVCTIKRLRRGDLLELSLNTLDKRF